MKKYNILIALLLLIGFNSCDDKLELEPHQSVSYDAAFETTKDFEIGLLGAYSEMRDLGVYGGYDLMYADVAADNLIQSNTGRLTLSTIQDWSWSSSHYYPASFWADTYDAINVVNGVLDQIEGFSYEETDEEFMNQIEGEALAVRALLHLNLVRYFGKTYNKADADDLGVPYMKESIVSSPARETVQSNYQDIRSDLESALTLMSESYDANKPQRITIQAVNAILARMYMDMHMFGDAADAAVAAIDGEEPVSGADFAAIWTDESNDGVLFKVAITEKDGQEIGNEFSQTGPDGTKSEYVVDFDLYSKFQSTDIRFSEYIETSGFEGFMYNNVSKYFGRPGATATPNLVDAKVIRLAEMYLTAAEAYYKDGNEADAIIYLDDLREKRYSDYTPSTETGDALLQKIYLERRLELAFEGDRFFFLKRTNQPVERVDLGTQNDDGVRPYPVLTLTDDDHRWQLPIPLDELNANTNEGMTQNPGY
ncbi:MAG: RagB/SusD family nutrient uptake outer membrane protein [Bacteroidales bacterium]